LKRVFDRGRLSLSPLPPDLCIKGSAIPPFSRRRLVSLTLPSRNLGWGRTRTHTRLFPIPEGSARRGFYEGGLALRGGCACVFPLFLVASPGNPQGEGCVPSGRELSGTIRLADLRLSRIMQKPASASILRRVTRPSRGGPDPTIVPPPRPRSFCLLSKASIPLPYFFRRVPFPLSSETRFSLTNFCDRRYQSCLCGVADWTRLFSSPCLCSIDSFRLNVMSSAFLPVPCDLAETISTPCPG